jgi:hypothetical protein
MKLRNMWLDGGSLTLATIMAGSAVVTIVGDIQSGTFDTVSAVIAVAFVAATGAFVWLSIRIGGNRKKIRDVRRWMGDKSNEPLTK